MTYSDKKFFRKAVAGITGALAALAFWIAVKGAPFFGFDQFNRHIGQLRLGCLLIGTSSLFAAIGCIRRRPYGWYLVSGLLVALIAAASIAGGYRAFQMELHRIHNRGLIWMQFLPTIMLALFLFRVWFGLREEFGLPRSQSADAPVKEIPAKAQLDRFIPRIADHESYAFMCACSPGQAKDVFQALEESGVRFEFDVARQRGRRELNPIRIYVHPDDLNDAAARLKQFRGILGET